MKTEFLVQIDGASTSVDARVVLIGATNRPDELDDAARRRFVKRLYIPLPDPPGRRQLFDTLLHGNAHDLSEVDVSDLVDLTAGYSGADIRSLCTEAAMGPVRDLAQSGKSLQSIRDIDVPSIQRIHFDLAFESVMPSVSPSDLKRYLDWNSEYGSFRRTE
jgi:fidgetin-like protein 1